MPKLIVEVTAEALVAVRFRIEVDSLHSLDDINKQATAAAERMAQSVIGSRSDAASASISRLTSFTVKLV